MVLEYKYLVIFFNQLGLLSKYLRKYSRVWNKRRGTFLKRSWEIEVLRGQRNKLIDTVLGSDFVFFMKFYIKSFMNKLDLLTTQDF